MSWKPREGVYLDSNYALVYPEGMVTFNTLQELFRNGNNKNFSQF